MKKLINDGWSFVKLPAGSTLHDAENASFEPVDLPHDWLIWQEDDLYENADAWYRRDLELSDGHDPVVIIRFDGVYMDCDVLLNGETISTHPYGYTAFDVPLTGRIKPGINRLMVHIRHQSPNSRWYSGSGIYRDVFLVTLPEDHMIPDGLYLKETEEEGNWLLDISAQTSGKAGKRFFCTLYDTEGNAVSSANGFSADSRINATMVIPDARPWSPENPYLYKLVLRYGEQTEVRRIGLRSVSIDPNQGLLLNGTHVRLKGICLHHDLGALGAAFHEKAAKRQLKLMQEMGANAVRTSHNPPAAKFLDLCDEMGILVVDEAFDMWEMSKTKFDYARFFKQWHARDIASWVRRDRCHPCVIMWSIGNEIYDIHASPRGELITEELRDLIREHDPLRRAFITFGCNYMPWEGGQKCAEHMDAVGYNYGEKLYEPHHAAHPSWAIYGSETASILSSRGIYHFPIEQSIMSDEDRQCSALGNSNTSWGADSLKKIVSEDLSHTFSLGQFIWSGIDYIGEPTPYHTRSCYFGQADTACFPKDSYYLLQSYWSERKIIHIGVSWDWNYGQMIDIPVMTNCFEAELFLNGRSIGKKKPGEFKSEKLPLYWKQPFVPGRITARGYDEQGRLICEDERLTPEGTDNLALSCEDENVLSDGWDLAFVTVAARDRSGRAVENARDRVKVHVSGGGRLIGTDNGDSTDTDSYKSDCRRLFSGKLLLIIASNGKKEDILIRIAGRKGMTAEMSIPVRHASILSGISYGMQAYQKTDSDCIPVRRIDIRADGTTELTPDHPECTFRYSVLPAEAGNADILWQATNNAGIIAPSVRLTYASRTVTVCAGGDGKYRLRALCRENGKCVFISEIEFSAAGFGSPALNPYTYISAGLYDLHEGEITSGNDKGIAFAGDSISMIGFRQVDFGRTGSDIISADLFALNDEAYDLDLCTTDMNGDEHRIGFLRYQKPSIWNVYQRETWKLSERLTGVQTLCFRMNRKIHMKGFIFERQERAYIPHSAASADQIYGDTFLRNGQSITGIGNNVTLTWEGMDFGGKKDIMILIDGRTDLPVSTIIICVRNEKGEESTGIADFDGTGETRQRFRLRVPDGSCSVSFVFLPGSSFDFYGFRFLTQDYWTETKE